MRHLPWLVVAVVSLLGGCTPAPPPAPVPEQGVYAGYYRSGFELSSFRPQGSSEQWWLNTESRRLLTPVAHAAQGSWIYIAVRGSVSPPGKYGHEDAYARELVVTEVLQMRVATTVESNAF